MQEGLSTPVVGCVIPHGVQQREILFHVASKRNRGRCPYIVFIEDDDVAASQRDRSCGKCMDGMFRQWGRD